MHEVPPGDTVKDGIRRGRVKIWGHSMSMGPILGGDQTVEFFDF